MFCYKYTSDGVIITLRYIPIISMCFLSIAILIKLRLKNKITQSDLAKKANVTQAKISKIESMSANPSFETLKKIGSAFNCKLTVDFISK